MISAFPILTEAQEALGRGNQEKAAWLVMSHLRHCPGEPRGLALLGEIAMKGGALLQAENFFQQALARGCKTVDVRQQLASCLHLQERLSESFQLWQDIVEERPADAHAKGVCALILDKLNRPDEARAIWERLVKENADKPPYWISYGLNLRGAGRTDEAMAAFRHAIATEPERGEAWWSLASMKTNVFSDEDIATMEQGLKTASDILNLSPLHFALGRARQHRKEYPQSFAHFTEANRLWAEAINYNAAELTEEVTEATRIFDRDYFGNMPAGSDQSSQPIFIVSLPRSGSTLLEQMLSTHPDVEPLGELSYIPALLRAVMEQATRRGRATVPQAVSALSPDQREEMGRDYLRRIAAHRKSDSPYFTDKLPHNWNNVIFIRHILPNARFINIRRSAVACCFANFSHSFARGHASSFALEHIGRAYRDYVRLMAHLDEAAPDMVHHVRYEELIEHPERELRQSLSYLGLPWDAAVLRFHETERTVRTPSAEQVRQPLNREGIGAWKPYEQWLDPLRKALGPLADA